MPSKQLKDSTVALAVAVPLVLPARNLRSTSVAKSDDCCKAQPYTPSRRERSTSFHAHATSKAYFHQSKLSKANHEKRPSQSPPAVPSSTPPDSSPLQSALVARSSTQSPQYDHPDSPLQSPLSSPAGAQPKSTLSAWWHRQSDILTALSVRSYHLSCASAFLTSKTEELALLNEIRAMNADGIRTYSEIIEVLQMNCGGAADIRIMWDMSAKRKCTLQYDEFIRQAITLCECEIQRGDNEVQSEGSGSSLVDKGDESEDFAVEVSVLAEPGVDTQGKIQSCNSGWGGDLSAIAHSSVEGSSTGDPSPIWIEALTPEMVSGFDPDWSRSWDSSPW